MADQFIPCSSFLSYYPIQGDSDTFDAVEILNLPRDQQPLLHARLLLLHASLCDHANPSLPSNLQFWGGLVQSQLCSQVKNPSNSAHLPIACFVLSHGPIAIAILAWQNSMVFHSLDKMTSFYIHIMPPLTCYMQVLASVFNIYPKFICILVGLFEITGHLISPTIVLMSLLINVFFFNIWFTK